jgi:hypothetical protein
MEFARRDVASCAKHLAACNQIKYPGKFQRWTDALAEAKVRLAMLERDSGLSKSHDALNG